MTVADYVKQFNLQPHPEGGYFAEMYRSEETIPHEALPKRFSGARAFSTAIYFLIEGHQYSTLHRIQADEVWHFYAGCPLAVYVIDQEGLLTTIRLGNKLDKGEVFQAVVPAGCWFGSKPLPASAEAEQTFSLVGCTVAPGFDFADFELADRTTLLSQFPQHQLVIDMLTNS